MIYVLLFIFPKWMLAKTVSAMKLIFHSGRQGPQMWIYCPFIALTAILPHPARESPCSASENNRRFGILWGARPWPVQPTSFHPRLFKGEGHVPATLPKGRESEQLRPCKLPSDPYLTSSMLIIVSLIEPLLWFSLCTLGQGADVGMCPHAGPTPTVMCQLSWALTHWCPDPSSRRTVPSPTRHLPVAVHALSFCQEKLHFTNFLNFFLVLFWMSSAHSLVQDEMSWKCYRWVQQNATIYSRSFMYLSPTQKAKQPELARDSQPLLLN